MKIYFVSLFFLFFTGVLYSQLYQGPANGSVSSGVIQNTNNFFDFNSNELPPSVKKPRNKERVEPYPDWMNKVQPTAPQGSNVFNDPGIQTDANPIILKNFQGFNDPGNYIPPDPYCAVGPLHVMGTDNGRFRIWDKNGNLLKSISADAWFASALTGAGAFDPKVSYDHFNKRWIMVWLDQESPPNARGYYLISVSDDSIPLGVWYNWAIKSSLFGMTESGTWSDYQGVGFDNQALYITGRQFGFYGGFYGCKLRIIPKTDLYANTAGALNWIDMWDIRDPGNISINPDNLRPAIMWSTASEYYFMTSSPYSSGTYLNLYKLTNPLTSPVLTGVNVPVVAYSSPPQAQQLGGGMPIESGGHALRNEPLYRSGFIWAVHSVSNGAGQSNVSYVKINTATNTAVEDYAYGNTNFYHFYPAICVDQNLNLIINFSRSSTSTYIGAYFTSRLNSDPPGTFSGVWTIQHGKANYVKDFSSGRNRWGDYMMAWLDPVSQDNFWTITEYAETPINTWSCQIANIRLVAFNGPWLHTGADSLTFSNTEVFFNGDTLGFKIRNYGNAALNVSNIQNFSNNFQILTPTSFPISLNYQDSVDVRVRFKPQTWGMLIDSLRISSNDPNNPQKKIGLKGRGFVITPVTDGALYGLTSNYDGGNLISINTATGNGTTIGPTGFTQLYGLAVRPSDGRLFASFSSSTSSTLYRVNSAEGDAYLFANIPVPNIRGIAFDNGDILYIASATDGKIFKFNLSNSDTDYVGSTGVANLFSIAINPLNGQLWGISLTGAVYKINKTDASATQVGNTGVSLNTAITFSRQGRFYLANGLGNTTSNIYTIDTSSGTASLIGSSNKKGINGIAMNGYPIGIEPISAIIPEMYNLYQNYPNPFNPVTKIRFDIPAGGQSVSVKMIVYDILGRETAILVNDKLKPGVYEVSWNASDFSSGIYFYRLVTDTYVNTKKFVLIK